MDRCAGSARTAVEIDSQVIELVERFQAFVAISRNVIALQLGLNELSETKGADALRQKVADTDELLLSADDIVTEDV